MNHTTHTAVAQGVPQVSESIDFSDELPLFGGSVEVVPPPWGDRRPPAKGNALTNR